MNALRVKVHFYRNTGSFETGIVGQRLHNSIYFVIFVLEDGCGLYLESFAVSVNRRSQVGMFDILRGKRVIQS